jgi:hypothetical protein
MASLFTRDPNVLAPLSLLVTRFRFRVGAVGVVKFVFGT